MKVRADPALAEKDGEYPGWSPIKCDTDNDSYTKWYGPNLSTAVVQPFIIFILVFLVLIQTIRNKYRDTDSSGVRAYRA